MMKYYTILMGLFLLSTISGCMEEVDLDLPNQRAMLVVYSTLCPQDSFLRVQVTQSEPLEVENSDDLPVLDLNLTEVFITGPNGTKRLPLHPNGSFFLIPNDSIPVVAGQTYSLVVRSPNFPTATGVTTIPLAVDNPEAYVASYYSIGSSAQTYVINTEWDDMSDQENYYLVTAGPSPIGFRNYWYVTDKEQDGQRFDRDFTVDGNYLNPDEVVFYQEVIHCTKAFFNYHRTSNNSTDFENPFAEPSVIYSNISNGIGCFAGYNTVFLIAD